MRKIFNVKKTIIMTVIMGIIIGSCLIANASEPCWVNASVLNCRTAPNINGEIIKTFNKNTPLTIIGCEGEWWEIWDGETQGWCHSNYLRLTEEEPKPVNDTPENGNMRYIGDFRITYYTTSPSENGGSNLTARGHRLKDVVGTCIAVDPRVIPYGTKVYIEGIGYRVAMDCGGAIKGNKIDVLVNVGCIPSHGVRYSKVYVVN